MRNPKRIPKVLAKLQKAWELQPDWRLGQLLVNLSRPMHKGYQIFHHEESFWEHRIDLMIERASND
jgi:hypothetical protein